MVVIFVAVAARIAEILMVGSCHLFILFISVAALILLRVVIVVLVLILRLVDRLLLIFSVEVLMVLILVVRGCASIAATHILFAAAPTIALPTALERGDVSILLVCMLLMVAILLIVLLRVIYLLRWPLVFLWINVLRLLELVCRVLLLHWLLSNVVVGG